MPRTKAATPVKAATRPEVDALVVEHKRLAWAVTKMFTRYLPAPRDVEGLFGECWAALARAAAGFDPARGCKFSTYAVPAMRNAAGRFVQLEMRRGFTWIGDTRPDRGPAEYPTVYHGHQQDGRPGTDESGGFLANQPERAGRGDVVVWSPAEWDRVLGVLRPADRRAVELVVVDGLTLDAAGRVLGVSKQRVQRRVARSLRVLWEQHPELIHDLPE